MDVVVVVEGGSVVVIGVVSVVVTVVVGVSVVIDLDVVADEDVGFSVIVVKTFVDSVDVVVGTVAIGFVAACVVGVVGELVVEVMVVYVTLLPLTRLQHQLHKQQQSLLRQYRQQHLLNLQTF
jgi:hypothetical protein